MAKFVFKMESILSIKLKLEEQAKAEYSIELAKLREEEEKLEYLEKQKDYYQSELKESVQFVLNVMKIKTLEDCVENIKYNMRMQIIVINQQQQEVNKAREKLNTAIRERKTYEKLKEKAFEEFKKELIAQEMKEVDELVSFRHKSV